MYEDMALVKEKLDDIKFTLEQQDVRIFEDGIAKDYDKEVCNIIALSTLPSKMPRLD